MRAFLKLHGLVWLAMTGHISSGAIFLFEHYFGHSIAWDWLIIPVWLFFCMAWFQSHRNLEKKNSDNASTFHLAIESQKSEFVALRHLITTRDTQVDQLILQMQQLNREAADKIGRPYVMLSYADVNYLREPDAPSVPYADCTEFTATCEDRDAYQVYLNRIKIGKMTIQSGNPVDKITRGESKKLPYVVLYYDPIRKCECVNLSFRGHLRNLLTQAIEDSGEESLNLIVSIRYLDIHGNAYETQVTLFYHPGIFSTPAITPISTRPLLALDRRQGSPDPESITHEN